MTTTFIPADGKVIDKEGLIKKFKTQKFYKDTDFTIDATGANFVLNIAPDVNIMGDALS